MIYLFFILVTSYSSLFVWLFSVITLVCCFYNVVGISSWSFSWYICWRWVVGCSLHSGGSLTFLIRTTATTNVCLFPIYLINLFFLALTEDYRNCWGCPFLWSKANSGIINFSHCIIRFIFHTIFLHCCGAWFGNHRFSL